MAAVLLTMIIIHCSYDVKYHRPTQRLLRTEYGPYRCQKASQNFLLKHVRSKVIALLQLLFYLPPVGQVIIHQCIKSFVVVIFVEMHHFVYQHVL